MHLLRNSADHGLESAELRTQRGKPAVGSIFLDAYQDGNNVVIEVRDDGNGIDVDQHIQFLNIHTHGTVYHRLAGSLLLISCLGSHRFARRFRRETGQKDGTLYDR